MKRILMVLFVLICGTVMAKDFPKQGVVYLDQYGEIQAVTASAPLPTTGSGGGSSSGTFSISGTMPLQYWAVGSPVSYQAAIATSAKTLLSSLASFTANTYVEMQANAKMHFGTYTTASATLQNCMYLSAGEVKGFRIGTSTFDLAVIADAAAVASLDVKIYTLY